MSQNSQVSQLLQCLHALLSSLAGFTIFVWLLNTTSVFMANTFAFVSPMFAIFLGRLFIDEAVTKYTLISIAMIAGAVLLLTFANYVKDLKACKNYNTIILVSGYCLYIAPAFIRSLFQSLFKVYLLCEVSPSR